MFCDRCGSRLASREDYAKAALYNDSVVCMDCALKVGIKKPTHKGSYRLPKRMELTRSE